MTAAERLFWRRIQRRVATLSPELRAAILQGFRALRAQLSEAELAQLVATTGPERLVAEVLDDETLDQALLTLRTVLRDQVETAGRAFTKDLPGAAGAIAFDVLNPQVVTAIQALDTRVITTLKAAIREAARAVVQRGLEAGVGPLAIARDLRDAIGLAPNQEAAVANFQRLLEGRDREVLTRALRDRRFDRTLLQALGPGGTGLSADQIATMTEAYRRRFLAFNAETNARTMALDAQKLGHRLSWQAAVDRGDIDGTRLMKRWATVGDDRVRPEHQAMEGEVVGHTEAFSNGEQIPGESTFNCRCVAIYFTAQDPLRARHLGRGAAAAAA